MRACKESANIRRDLQVFWSILVYISLVRFYKYLKSAPFLVTNIIHQKDKDDLSIQLQ